MCCPRARGRRGWDGFTVCCPFPRPRRFQHPTMEPSPWVPTLPCRISFAYDRHPTYPAVIARHPHGTRICTSAPPCRAPPRSVLAMLTIWTHYGCGGLENEEDARASVCSLQQCGSSSVCNSEHERLPILRPSAACELCQIYVPCRAKRRRHFRAACKEE